MRSISRRTTSIKISARFAALPDSPKYPSNTAKRRDSRLDTSCLVFVDLKDLPLLAALRLANKHSDAVSVRSASDELSGAH